MDIILNGKPKEVAKGTTVSDLLEELGLGKTVAAVEINRLLIPKRLHAQTQISESDSVEVVTLVGGG